MELHSAPDGFRLMTPVEGDSLTAGRMIMLFDRSRNAFHLATVVSFTSAWGWRVTTVDPEAMPAVDLDDDNPDFWSDADEASGRERRGPQSSCGRFVAVVAFRTRRSRSSLPSHPPYGAAAVSTKRPRSSALHTSAPSTRRRVLSRVKPRA